MDQIDHPTRTEFGGPGDGVRAVSLIVPSGSVDIVAHPDPYTAVLEVHEVSGAPLAVSFEGGTLKVEQYKDSSGQVWGALKGFLGGAFGAQGPGLTGRITLSVPREAKVSLKTVTADALVGGAAGDVSAHSVSGTLTLDHLAGVVDVNAVSGDVEAAGCSGELKAKTVSGRITVQDAVLRSVKLNSVSGAAVVDLRTGPCLITANTVSGDLTVRMPAATGYDATVSSTSGHVVVDGQTLHSEDGKRGGHRYEGDRSVALKARTVSGNVVVLRDGGSPGGGGTAGPVVGQAHPGSEDVQDVRRPAPEDPQGSTGEGL